MTEWVIDTCVVAGCDDLQSDWCNTAIALLEKVFHNGRVCLDHGGVIKGEYWRVLKMKPRGHAINWWNRMLRVAGKIQHYDGKVPPDHKDELVRLGFPKKDTENDIGDIAFVGVAMRADKMLVTEDRRHYSGPVCEYLAKRHSIKVFSVTGAYSA